MRLMRITAAGMLALALAAASPVRAADADKFLPNDTEMLLSLDVRQLLDSPLVKKVALGMIRDQIAKDEKTKQTLDALGMDPLKDVDRVTVGGTSVGGDKAVVVINGKFNKVKLDTAAAAYSLKDEAKDKFTILKGEPGRGPVYELKSDKQPMFALVLDDSTILAATSKDMLNETAGRAAATPKFRPEFAKLLSQSNTKSTLHLVTLVKADSIANLPVPIDDNAKAMIQKVAALTVGLNVSGDVKLDVNLHAKDAASAKEFGDKIAEGLTQAKQIAPLLANQGKGYELLGDLANSLKSGVKEVVVTIEAELAGSAIEKAIKD